MASSLYAVACVDAFDATGLDLDLTAVTNKAALFTATLAPNFLTNTDFTAAPYTSDEVTSANYTAGGQALGAATWAAAGAAPVLTYDAPNLLWDPVSFTARWLIFYADALAGNNLFYALDFGSNFTATTGPFAVNFHALGIFTWTL